MRSETFRTAAELGIEPHVRRAMIDLLYRLEAGEIPHAYMTEPRPIENKYEPVAFNMQFVEGETDCGTACCMLGWIRHITRDHNALTQLPHCGPLPDLFCMGPAGDSTRRIFLTRKKEARDILPHEGAKALRNFLNGKQLVWEDAFA